MVGFSPPMVQEQTGPFYRPEFTLSALTKTSPMTYVPNGKAVVFEKPNEKCIQTKESLEHDLKVSNLFFAIAES